jgi:hypothetical protein
MYIRKYNISCTGNGCRISQNIGVANGYYNRLTRVYEKLKDLKMGYEILITSARTPFPFGEAEFICTYLVRLM